MCRLMAICSDRMADPAYSFKALRRLSYTDRQEDGWGIGFYEDGIAKVYKEDKPAYKSRLAADIEEGRVPARSRIILSHIRRTIRCDRGYDNTHPFHGSLFGKHWMFAHNGALYGYEKLETGGFKPTGGTGSEHAFCFILDQLDRHCSEGSPVENVSKIIEGCAYAIREGGGDFNFVMSDSEHLFCFGDSSLYYTEPGGKEFSGSGMVQTGGKAVIVATRPLTEDEKWQRIRGLKVFKDGMVLDV